MLPSACSFIVDGLTFSCRCTTLHISAYMVIFTHPTDENVHSVTTCKKGKQKQRSRFLQEYKSETYTHEDGHVGRNM
jgi:hypothetical protein